MWDDDIRMYRVARNGFHRDVLDGVVLAGARVKPDEATLCSGNDDGSSIWLENTQ